jgi:hypothetical protein
MVKSGHYGSSLDLASASRVRRSDVADGGRYGPRPALALFDDSQIDIAGLLTMALIGF